MKIEPGNLANTVNRDLLADLSKVLKVGQVLNAKTELGGDTSSKVLLRVGQHLFETKTPLPLQNGQEIKLLVKMPGDIKTGSLPLFKILTPLIPAAAASAANTQSKIVAVDKLRQFISVQQSFSQLQQHNQALLSNKSAVEQLPQNLKVWLNKIQESLLLENKGITASQLKQHILNSGIFLESKLRNQLNQPVAKQETPNPLKSPLNNDLKYQLLALRTELKQFNYNVPGVKSPISQSLQQPAVPLTPQQLKQLQSEIQKTGNNTLELSNKLLTQLPVISITKIMSMLSSPLTKVPATDDLQTLAQLLTNITRQHGHVAQKQASLIEQLQFRLMLLDLGQQVEQSINKLNSLQLQPLIRDDDNLMLLLFNLVFKDSNQQFDVNFRIQQQDENSDKEKENWQIILAFNFKTLGNVQSKIFLTGDKVSTVFYAEQTKTADKIKQLLPLLETGLAEAGLKVNKISVTIGELEDKPVVNRGISLLDETA